MEYINKIELRGTVGSFRELRSNDQRRGASISLLTQIAYHNRSGEATIDSEWHNVKVWEGKNIPDSFWKIQKGDKLHVIGRIKSQKYTSSDGTERYSYDILPTKIEIVDSEDGLQIEIN